ncbi:FG-GAP repeat protein [uncultured Paludibaculum sp.]|uniref:FG-GAP repeat protein n=1 Tax=uncultured Paludibaculum sp. TaxID=1765020 RepID=UPI002AABBB5E|nr:FG-GAP repeat protein [uncultured Paludibaculum sp.]
MCLLPRTKIHLQGLPLALLFIAPLPAQIRGGAMVTHPRPAILTWGSQLQLWPLDGSKPELLQDKTNFGSAGCIADVDGDGQDDLLVQQHPGTGPMVWLKAPSWRARVVEKETDFHDCLEFTLDGRRGVLVPHFNSQLRFYLFPGFEYKEIYSIYTASKQGGMLTHDVDHDGLPDLFLGNYWVRNPGKLDVDWRLYAINIFHETPGAALAAFGMWKDDWLFWAETSARPGRIVAYQPPPDRKQLWIEHRLEPLDEPRAILVHPRGVFIGHAGGVVLESLEGTAWHRTTIAKGIRVLKLLNDRDNVIALTPEGPRWVYPLR